MTGVVGPLALAAVILYSQGKKEEMEQLISKYIIFLIFELKIHFEIMNFYLLGLHRDFIYI